MVNTSQSTSQCSRWVLLRFTRSLVLSVASCNVKSSRVCLDEGYNFLVHVSSTMASLMLSRQNSLFLESLPACCTRGHVHREFSVSPQHPTSTCCGADCSAPHTHPSTRCACRALSPELDCSGRCLAKRLHEPCFHDHCINSTPVKSLITRSFICRIGFSPLRGLL